MNVPLLDSKGNPMEFGKYYYLHPYFVDGEYLGVKSYDNTMMRFKFFGDTEVELFKYDPLNRPEPQPIGYVYKTDNEDDSDNDFGGGKSKKKKTIKRRKRISNKKRKTNKNKKKRKSSKRRK
jgi:hypothetical protein